jgi:ribosomal protein S18 acetylase RimI-like enzyme
MDIRAASLTDIPAIIEIERTPGFEQSSLDGFSEDEHRAHLTDPDCRVLVLLEGDVIDGFAILRGNPWRRQHSPEQACGPRPKGAGQRLLDHAKAIAFAEPATQRFWLRVAETNSRARHVYERNGLPLETRLPAGEGQSPASRSILRFTGFCARLAVRIRVRLPHADTPGCRG